jgi:hypothetical protein
VLPDGRVLVIGGSTGKTSWDASARVDIFDPATRTWSRGADLPEARVQPAVVLLPDDGSVLVIGGAREQTPLATAYRYRPDGSGAGPGRWEPAGIMTTGRVLATATRLRSGRVLVAGGGATGPVKNDAQASYAATAAAEVYDPATGRWTRTAPMGAARAMHTATLLPDGRVLVAGGASRWSNVKAGRVYGSAEAYDETAGAGTWTPVADMAEARYAHGAATLQAGAFPDGSVMVAGGWGRDRGDARDTAEVYDATGDRWASVDGRMSVARAQVPLVDIGSGLLLAVGGAVDAKAVTPACDLFDAATGRWAPAASLTPGVAWPAVVPIGPGEALVASGATGVATAGVTGTTPRVQLYGTAVR